MREVGVFSAVLLSSTTLAVITFSSVVWLVVQH
jgi:hypothetical protein